MPPLKAGSIQIYTFQNGEVFIKFSLLAPPVTWIHDKQKLLAQA